MRTALDVEVLPAIILNTLTVYKGIMPKFQLFGALHKFTEADKEEALLYLFEKSLVYFRDGKSNGDCVVESNL